MKNRHLYTLFGLITLLTCPEILCEVLLGKWLQMPSGKCAIFRGHKLSWDKAQSACSDLHGGELLTLRDEADQAWFTDIMRTYVSGYLKVTVWIGLYRNLTDYQYYWGDGHRVEGIPRIDWMPGRPHYKAKAEETRSCVRFAHGGSQLLGFISLNCASNLQHVCTKEDCTGHTDAQHYLCAPQGLVSPRSCVTFNFIWTYMWEDAVYQCQKSLQPRQIQPNFTEHDLRKFTSWMSMFGSRSDYWIALPNQRTELGCPMYKAANRSLTREGQHACLQWKGYVCPVVYSKPGGHTLQSIYQLPCYLNSLNFSEYKIEIDECLNQPAINIVSCLGGVVLGSLITVAFGIYLQKRDTNPSASAVAFCVNQTSQDDPNNLHDNDQASPSLSEA